MTKHSRWTCHAVTALYAAPLLTLFLGPVPAAFAQSLSAVLQSDAHAQFVVLAQAKRGGPDKKQNQPPAEAKSKELPPRVPYTATEAAVASIPGMPDARFWADSEADFKAALPSQSGPWLILSSGGGDGAFGAGLLTGLSAAGKRPDYAVVTGVSTGSLMVRAMTMRSGMPIRRSAQPTSTNRAAAPARVLSIPGRCAISSPNRLRRN
jgi:hypothetical protein